MVILFIMCLPSILVSNLVIFICVAKILYQVSVAIRNKRNENLSTENLGPLISNGCLVNERPNPGGGRTEPLRHLNYLPL